MLQIILIMAGGLATGWLLRNRTVKLLDTLLLVLVWALLFFLGVEAGVNPSVIGGLKELGLEALLLAIAGTAGSIAAAWALWRYINHNGGDTSDER